MFVILSYDVKVKRVSKVMKTCRKYLSHVQNSVFEGSITEKNLNKLKNEIERIIDKDTDRVSIYEMQSLKYTTKERIGLCCTDNNIF